MFILALYAPARIRKWLFWGLISLACAPTVWKSWLHRSNVLSERDSKLYHIWAEMKENYPGHGGLGERRHNSNNFVSNRAEGANVYPWAKYFVSRNCSKFLHLRGHGFTYGIANFICGVSKTWRVYQTSHCQVLVKYVWLNYTKEVIKVLISLGLHFSYKCFLSIFSYQFIISSHWMVS